MEIGFYTPKYIAFYSKIKLRTKKENGFRNIMAKFVIAGKSNCPYFAKAELLGDQLSRNLSDFKIHKIVKEPSEWDVRESFYLVE